ncbi:MAG: NERD domain-containing protein/DEAD/DEAH box helicase [Candidatus Limnocylindria bacterium]
MRSAGEERLASALETTLKQPWAMYRNVAWLEKRPGDEPADGEADVVLAHPELGVMVIEVKGGRVQRIGGRWESVDGSGIARRIKDPFAQVMREMHGLRRVCEAMPAWPAHRVKIMRAVCLPDSAYDQSMTADGPREIVVDHADLVRAGERIGEICDWWSASGDAAVDGGAPGPTGMVALHTLLARDLEIPSPLAAGVAADEARIRLSDQQFNTLDMLASHRRALILGVAGSGKTLLAAEKARRLAAQGFEVLLTCFNRPLAEHLAATIGRLDRITVSTFHGLAERLGTEAGLIGPSPSHDTAYFDGLPDVLDRALTLFSEPRFDAIVVDEGQDLDSVWWLPLLDLLRDPATGIVYVFADANQDLYHAREPVELGVVMPESPPIFHLNENRRSTQAIHSFASRWATPSTDAPAPMATGPEGRPVEIFTYPDGEADACRKVLGTALRRIIDAGRVAHSDVVVLTPRSHRSSWLMGSAPVEAWPYRLMPEYGAEGAVLPLPTKGNEVRVATIHRYKGLESPVVVLAEIDGRVADEDLAALLYVGATRARSHLVVIASEKLAERIGPASKV